jgi:hypothetical protein
MKIGDIFNWWTLVNTDIIDGKILCRCNCGTTKPVSIHNLKKGISKSCGCKPRKLKGESNPITPGEKFGKLTVLGESQSVKSKNGKNIYNSLYFYECLCECGNTKLIKKSQLKNGVSVSCGCTELGPTLYKKLPRWVVRNIRSNADVRNKEWDLDLYYLGDLLESQNYKCFYTGWDLKIGKNGKEKTLSLDRIDSTKGYIRGSSSATITVWSNM